MHKTVKKVIIRRQKQMWSATVFAFWMGKFHSAIAYFFSFTKCGKQKKLPIESLKKYVNETYTQQHLLWGDAQNAFDQLFNASQMPYYEVRWIKI